DRAPLNVQVTQRDTSNENWNLERVSFDAAYGKERMMAVVLTPKSGRPPYQSVIYFPGSGVLSMSSSKERRDQIPSFVVKSGRAVILPILKSTYERQDTLKSDVQNRSILWRDHVTMWVKDIRRTVDYVQSRSDMDSSRIAYFGTSWGSAIAPINLVVEPRFKTAVLLVAGLAMEETRQEVDPWNYLPRVKLPVLMLNGKYDYFFPLELSQKPFYRTLGTAGERKKYIVYEGGHDVPRTELIKETLAWLDRWVGVVR
ncbi:MAG: dienelactone hydrolase family protein, partial [Polaromonas sp.]|nr:dienelactone hydrolase family protein [Gemmatimonadaceae bacterium]